MIDIQSMARGRTIKQPTAIATVRAALYLVTVYACINIYLIGMDGSELKINDKGGGTSISTGYKS